MLITNVKLKYSNKKYNTIIQIRKETFSQNVKCQIEQAEAICHDINMGYIIHSILAIYIYLSFNTLRWNFAFINFLTFQSSKMFNGKSQGIRMFDRL